MATRGRSRLVDRLSSITSKGERLAVGLMSGTSCDAIDAALVRLSGPRAERSVHLEGFLAVPMPPELRDAVRSARRSGAAELARLSIDLGEAFAESALRVIEESGRRPRDVDIVGSHGQTVHHEPPTASRGGATLQLGDGDVIARRVGAVTVSDFRAADVAAGGSGAPLIPLVDWLLFRSPGRPRLMLNLGGIANVTFVPDELGDVIAFDTGPGNALVDEIVTAATGGRETFDRDGRRGLAGRPQMDVVDEFLSDSYFAARPPKSTGKERFGEDAALRLCRRVTGGHEPDGIGERGLQDLLATAAMITARAVRDAAGSFTPKAREVIVSGGGLKNRAIMSHLTALFDPVPVIGLDALGMDPDAKEAVGFAVLANETIEGSPGNVPSATGALGPVVLGKISAGL